MKVLVLHHHGTEITELIAPIDILKRAGIEVHILHNTCIDTPLEHEYVVDKSVNLSDINTLLDYDALIIPGGKRGVANLESVWAWSEGRMVKLMKEMFDQGKLLAAICAAPSILGKDGFLIGKKYTCYPGWESDSYKGIYTGKEVEIDGNIITGKSMYYSTDFGLAILEHLMGKNKRIEIEKKVKGII